MWNGRELEQKVAKALDCIGKGAAALSEAGTTVFYMSNAMQKQGLARLLHSGWQDDADDSPSAPLRTTRAKSKLVVFEPQDNEEKLAIIQLRLQRAMAEQNISRVQQLSRELDELEGCCARDAHSGHSQPARFANDSDCHGSHVNKHTIRGSRAESANVPSATVPPDSSRSPSNIPSTRVAGVCAQHECMQATARDAEDVAPSHYCCPVPPCCYRQCCTRSEHPSRPPFDVPRPAQTSNAIDFGTTAFSLPRLNLPASVDGKWMARQMVSSSALYGMYPTDNWTTPLRPGMPLSQPPVVSMQSSTRAEAMHLDGMERTAIGSMHRNFLRSSCNPNRAEQKGEVSELHHSHGIILLPGPCDSTSNLAQATMAGSSAPSQTQCVTEQPLLHTMRSTTAPVREATREPAEEESPEEDDAQDEANVDEESKQLKHQKLKHMQQEADSLGDFDYENGSEEEARDANELCELESHLELPQTQSAVQCMVPPEKQHQPEAQKEITGEDTSDAIGLPPLPDVYEVEKVLDMRTTADGKREFLIKWTGWGPSWNNWEPENHILDKRLLRKFNKKKREETDPPEQVATTSIAIQSKRRCAKAATIKARAVAEAEDSE